MRIIDLDNTRVVMIRRQKFELLLREPITTGVNLADPNKLMKTAADNTDTLTLLPGQVRLQPAGHSCRERRSAAHRVQAEPAGAGLRQAEHRGHGGHAVLDSAELNKIVQRWHRPAARWR
jgi:hypothetical protein